MILAKLLNFSVYLQIYDLRWCFPIKKPSISNDDKSWNVYLRFLKHLFNVRSRLWIGKKTYYILEMIDKNFLKNIARLQSKLKNGVQSLFQLSTDAWSDFPCDSCTVYLVGQPLNTKRKNDDNWLCQLPSCRLHPVQYNCEKSANRCKKNPMA